VGHHSPRRSTQFFSRKVTKAVADIKAGRIDKLILGDVSRLQDWGDASEFMDAVVDIINMPPGNYTIGTNLPRTLADWVETAFKVAGLEAADWVEYHQQMVQPTDVPILSARTSMPLSWRATRTFEDLCRWMVEADLKASP
jgi:GDPmannose 4,6-dehydratase